MTLSDTHRQLPEADRLSLLAATILLVYAVSRFIELPERELALQLPGVYLSVQFGAGTLVALLVAALTAAGADWLVRTHPAYRRQSVSAHWLLPALTAWVLELPLLLLPPGMLWWAGFLSGGVLLMAVLVAEYIVTDPDDERHPLAAAGLTAVSFALFLVLASALRFSQARLFLLLPALSLAAGLVSWRTLHLHATAAARWPAALVIALLSAQIAAALHYWPLSPVAYGLAVLGPAYSLTSLFVNLSGGQPFRQAAIEPALVLAIIWLLAWWLG